MVPVMWPKNLILTVILLSVLAVFFLFYYGRKDFEQEYWFKKRKLPLSNTDTDRNTFCSFE
jgi:Na+/proline symporter